MDANEYKSRGKEMIDYIANYLENVSQRKVFPSVKPGYLAPLLPKEAPKKPDKWDDIMSDVESKIMPGITHWNHPQFFAYFPAGNSYASFLGDMLSDGIGCIGFSWASSPACTELETIVLDWLGKAINLPDFFFYFTPNSKGGGVIQGSASECVLVCMLAARSEAIKYLKEQAHDSETEDSVYLPKLVAYTSQDAHSCVEKAAKICLVKIRILKPDAEYSLRGPTLAEAIQEDIRNGFHPFFVAATLGTTEKCSFDNLREIGPIVTNLNKCWLHVDAAYAGCAFICPELRYLKEGVEFADSFNTNCNKFLATAFDCSCMWIKDRFKLISALTVEPLYLQHDQTNVTISYRHWTIPLSRRFRSLKLWFVLRNYGIEKLQAFIRNHIKLAELFESMVNQDDRFEVTNIVRLGVVCFRLKAKNEINQELLGTINKSGSLHLLPAVVKDKYCLRFCIVYEHSKPQHIEKAWSMIQGFATEILNKFSATATVALPIQVVANHRFSFIQMVPPEIYDEIKNLNMLKDEVSPVYVPGIPLHENITQVSAASLSEEEL